VLRVNSAKVQYKRSDVELLGVTVDGRSMRPSEIKRNEALEYKRPESIKKLRRFLGLAEWFRSFIKNFAITTEELTNSLKTGGKWCWTNEIDDDFESVEEALRNTGFVPIAPDLNFIPR
jgi:hypothetical protein